MYPLLRPLLFRLEPERAHQFTLQLLRLTAALAPTRWLLTKLFDTPRLPVNVFGLAFRNPIGLAAGYDKDGLGWRGLACLGFGHIEIGSVTPRPQEGNPKPRVFRLPEDRALINRMGFPGKGADFVKKQLSAVSGQRSAVILGVNIGKNKDTPLETAAEDYVMLVHQFAPLADYLTINVSSPNTVGLRRLQGREMLGGLLTAVAAARDEQKRRVPLLVKLAPDLNDEELDDALEAVCDNKIDGVIATNTTLSRAGLRSARAAEAGGLSGAPLRAASTEIVRAIFERTQGKLPIVSAGGVFSAADALEKLEAGASLVQIYTGLIYEGPGLARRILTDENFQKSIS